VTMTSIGQRARFPEHKERLKQWQQKIPKDLKADQRTEYMGVCKRHFDQILVNLEYSATAGLTEPFEHGHANTQFWLMIQSQLHFPILHSTCRRSTH
jgi:THAP domain